jgi:serine/threonine protein kinase
MSRPIGAAPLRAPTNVSETADGTYDEDVEALLSKLEAAPVVDWSELGEMTPVGVGEYCTASACALHGARVAVKRLKQEKQSDPIAVSDLAREAQLLARMRHENVISVVAQGTYACGASARGELPFLCLEMLASTLAAELPPSSVSTSPWVRKAGVRAWPLSRSINVALQISRALRYCHDEWVPGYRLLHRDLKPANVGFTSSGRVVLYDFGLCKLWSRGGGESDTHEMRKLTG